MVPDSPTSSQPVPADAPAALPFRRFGRTDLARTLIGIVGLAGAFAATYFVLPFAQRLMIASTSSGPGGPWVIRPIAAFHFGACAISAAVLFPLIMRLTPLARKWKVADAGAGSRYDPFHQRPGKRLALLVKGALLLVIYAVSFAFYLFSWITVGPSGIEMHLPWGVRHYTYDQVISLQTIQTGYRSEELAQNGPWDNIKLNDRDVNFSLDNEGTSAADLRDIEALIAAKSGKSWHLYGDARPSR